MIIEFIFIQYIEIHQLSIMKLIIKLNYHFFELLNISFKVSVLNLE